MGNFIGHSFGVRRAAALLFFALAAATAQAKIVNLVQNPGFESATNGAPDDFTLTGAWAARMNSRRRA